MTQAERIIEAMQQEARNKVIRQRIYFTLAVIAVAALVVIAWKM